MQSPSPLTVLLPALSGLPADGAADAHGQVLDVVRRSVSAPVQRLTLHAALFAQVLDGTSDAVAWAPPLVARDLLRQGLATPLVAADASTEYAAVLVGHPDIESLADIAGTRVGWVSRLSATGYRVPRMYLASFGLELGTLFASERFYGSHAAVARALGRGEIDVAATHSGRLLDVIGPTRGRVLASVGPVPPDLVVASAGLPGATKNAIIRALYGTTAGRYRFRFARPSHLDLFDLLGAEPVAPRPAFTPSESGVMLC